MAGQMKLARLGLALIAVGVILAFLAALLPLLAAGAGEAGVAGCVLVFFVPVCFGVGPLAPYLMVAAMLIALALLLVAYFLFRAALEELRPESYPPAPGGT
ncbi:MAG: hypothetical protein LM565_06015 [Thermofilum sp.]|nr:hypothetical protein [Thermofilum sp.]